MDESWIVEHPSEGLINYETLFLGSQCVCAMKAD